MAALSGSAIADRLAAGATSAAELMQALRVSQTTISRALRDLERQQRVVRIGSTRGARYALRRPIAQIGSQWPLYRIDAEGAPHELGAMTAIERDSFVMRDGPARIAGTFQGFPYYLQDARPAGFLGRGVPSTCPEFGLPARVNDWTDEHVLIYLTQRGSDSTGNLIVGAEALNRYLAAIHSPAIVPARDRPTAYPGFANAAMAGAPPGSSAHGEHPKFTACLADGDQRTHVIVKFSPPRATPVGQRWADLLTAEFTAHRVLEEEGIAACRSRLFDHDDRVFLECDRFDRIGANGRLGAVSLHAVDAARYGSLDNWTAAAERLSADSLLARADVEEIRLIDAFGALIANSDRHFGNVTLFDRYAGPFELAPVYDMLPMLFAPQDGQLVPRQFEPPAPRAEWLAAWAKARSLAEEYWSRIANDAGISKDFRQLAAQALERLHALPRRAAPVQER
jgi:hypothetical protein